VTASGVLTDGLITTRQKLTTSGYVTIGDTKFYEWNRRGWGPCDVTCGFAHSSDTFFYQAAGMLGIDRLAYWANDFGFGRLTGIDLPGEVPGIVPSNQWKLETKGTEIYPGETAQAGIGQGYDVVTPIQLINAYAALANGGTLYEPRVVRDVVGPDGSVVQAYQPTVLDTLDVPAGVLETMRKAARQVITLRLTTNNVGSMPLVIAGKSGTAEFGIRDAKGRLPYHSWFVAFLPKDPTPNPADPGGLKAVARTDSDLVVLAFAYDSRTKSNAAIEVVKGYLQMHYGLQGDFRLPDKLVRGNFYEAP
jgi:penicillin-binding protein 2